MSVEETIQRAEVYIKQSLLYLNNASEEIGKQKYEKASEFLWGSVAEALKAVLMARKGFRIKSHGELWDVARELSKEYCDEDIYVVFREANSLHSNFYEVSLKEEDVMISFERVRILVGKLLDIARFELIKLTKEHTNHEKEVIGIVNECEGSNEDNNLPPGATEQTRAVFHASLICVSCRFWCHPFQ